MIPSFFSPETRGIIHVDLAAGARKHRAGDARAQELHAEHERAVEEIGRDLRAWTIAMKQIEQLGERLRPL